MRARLVAAAAGLTTIAMLAGVAGAAGQFRLPLVGPSGGGGTSTDGYYSLSGSLGQPLAGGVSGADLRLDAGLLAGGGGSYRRVVPAVAKDR